MSENDDKLRTNIILVNRFRLEYQTLTVLSCTILVQKPRRYRT